MTRGRRATLRDMPDVLALFSNIELATALGVPYATAAAMKLRGWADPVYFVDLVAAMNDRGRALTYEMLCRWTKARGLTPRPKSAAAPVRRTTRGSRSVSATGPPP
jgi:hypothetical protein